MHGKINKLISLNFFKFFEGKEELVQKVSGLKEKMLKELEESETNGLIVNEIVPKKRLYDVVCNIIIKYKDVFNFHKLARMIQLKRAKQLKDKEKLMEKNFHGNGSFKQTSVKFFSSNTKIKTKSDNISFNSKNSFKFFSNSGKLKTKSDSKLNNSIMSVRRTQIEGARGSLLADFKQYMDNENKKKEEKLKNLKLFEKKMRKIEQVPVSIVNGNMMNFLDSEISHLKDVEKKITHSSMKKTKVFRLVF